MKLSAVEWREVFELLDTALDLPDNEVAPWLETTTASRPHLREPLRVLLDRRSALARDSFLSLPSSPAANDAWEAGATVGPYRLLRRLGVGGMGEVWLGERSDGQLQRRVAIKLPGDASSRADLLERFARERNILATLTHPNIARLYDAGETTSGQPYLVLEYVEGQVLTDYCDQRRLTVPERLTLFLQVLDAVQYAHMRLVIHRDIKPANILVTGANQVRLLDFGIAKLLDAHSNRISESDLTRAAGRALTPQYASPEQITGETLTTAADVYSLGVLLHELLCGDLPYQLKRGSAAELEEAILTAEPVTLTRNLSDQAAGQRSASRSRLTRELRGDLTTIVFKALQKTPQARYATVAAFAADIQNHLAKRPLDARADSATIRLWKMVQRNRLAFASATAVFAALTIGLGTALLQTRRAEQQANLARVEARKAEFVKDFLLEIFTTNSRQQTDPLKAQATTAVQLLDRAAARLQTLSSPSPDLNDDLLSTVGTLYGQMRATDKAVAIRKLRLDQALQSFPKDDPRITAAQLEYGGALYDSAGWKAAIDVLNDADAAMQARGDTSSRARARLDTLLSEYWRGTNPLKARELAARSIKLYRERYSDDPDLANALHNAGLIEGSLVNMAGAEVFYRQALATMIRLKAHDAYLVQPMVMLAETQRLMLLAEPAEANFHEALAISKRVNGDSHVDTLQTQLRYGQYLRVVGRNRESLQVLASAEKSAVQKLGDQESFHLPTIRAELANTLFQYGDTAGALAKMRMALVIREQTRPDTAQHANMLVGLAHLLLGNGQVAEAARLMERAEIIIRKIGLPIHALRFPVVHAEVLLAQGRAREALTRVSAAEAAVEAAAAAAPQAWRDVLHDCSLRLQHALALTALGDYAGSESLLIANRRTAAASSAVDFFSGVETESAMGLAAVYLKTNRAHEARQLLREVVDWRQPRVLPESPALREARIALSLAEMAAQARPAN